MRVRLTLEYDTVETLAYEHKEWITGNVTVQDFVACLEQGIGEDITIKIEEVK